MNQQPLVSICVPIFGVENYIERCAKSLFEQTYLNIEYIFINDCTLDKSIEILQNVIENYPLRKSAIHIIDHKQNSGLATARNTAVKYCTGDFIMHVDSDDYIDKDTIKLCIKKQLETNADIIKFGIYIEHKNNTTITLPRNYKHPKELCIDIISRRTSGSIWGNLYRRKLYIDHNIKVKDSINIGEDYQVTPILAFYANKISSVNTPLYHYNLTNTNSYIHNFSEKYIIQMDISFQTLKNFFLNKGYEYQEALYRGEYEIIINYIKEISQNKKLKHYYYPLKNRLKNIPQKYKTDLSIPYHIIGKLPTYYMVYLYVAIIRKFKK